MLISPLFTQKALLSPSHTRGPALGPSAQLALPSWSLQVSDLRRCHLSKPGLRDSGGGGLGSHIYVWRGALDWGSRRQSEGSTEGGADTTRFLVLVDMVSGHWGTGRPARASPWNWCDTTFGH